MNKKISIHDWSIAAINHPRAMDLQTLLGHVHTHIQPSNLKVYQDLAQAAQSVSTNTSIQDLIVVFGSFHTISETLVALLGRPY
ncbi:Dihydrofolate synthase [Moraxella catarrhalis]|nr:Dihydrofolate synthase [Moraxella catarrhalis]